MVGQEKLISKINSLTLDTFPHSLIISGEKGSGKHTLCGIISEKLNLPIIDITNNISLDLITEITLSSNVNIYLIDGVLLTEKKENVLLKFLEEPLKNSYIIILCEFTEQLLPTIRNRCQIWKMEKYTKEELSVFTSDEWILEIANTPGMIKKLEKQDLASILSLVNTIIDRIGNANYANALTISDKIAFKGEEDKYDLDIFIDFLLSVIKERIKRNEGDIKKLMTAYVLTKNLSNARYIPHINMKYELDSYLTNLKTVLK